MNLHATKSNTLITPSTFLPLQRIQNRLRILAVSRQPEEIYAERALRAGASGYWMKTGPREELIHAIETIVAGELYVSPRIALRGSQRGRPPDSTSQRS